jgi:hypothetical protein
MWFMEYTLAVSQLPMAWLKTEADLNMLLMVVTSAVFQSPMA